MRVLMPARRTTNMKILLLNYNDRVIGTLELVNGVPVTSGLADEIPTLKVIEPGSKVVVTPADGDRYLQAARWLYRGPYVRAVVEGEYTPRPRSEE